MAGSAALVAILLQLAAAEALHDPTPTSLWLEASPDDDRAAHCDWHLTGEAFLGSPSVERLAQTSGCAVVVHLDGTLNAAGASQFGDVSDALRDADATVTHIVLDSRGGIADAALEIAERIRTDLVFRRAGGGVATEISDRDTAVCFSACLLVFAAGFERRAEFEIYGDPRLASRLGIHRPARFDRRSDTFDSRRSSLEILVAEQKMRRYFRRVGVDTRIVDDMFAVPFDEIHLITRAEALEYRLIGKRDLSRESDL